MTVWLADEKACPNCSAQVTPANPVWGRNISVAVKAVVRKCVFAFFTIKHETETAVYAKFPRQ